MIRTTTAALTILGLTAISAQAGSLTDPIVEPTVVLEDTVTSSGNGNGLLVGTLMLAVLATAAGN